MSRQLDEAGRTLNAKRRELHMAGMKLGAVANANARGGHRRNEIPKLEAEHERAALAFADAAYTMRAIESADMRGSGES